MAYVPLSVQRQMKAAFRVQGLSEEDVNKQILAQGQQRKTAEIADWEEKLEKLTGQKDPNKKGKEINKKLSNPKLAEARQNAISKYYKEVQDLKKGLKSKENGKR